MAYNIYKSDGSALIALDDYIIDNTTLSINLIGKNVSGYGVQQNENFLYLLENFSKETPPASPLAGQLWYDKATNVMRPMVFDGGTWRPLSVTLYSNTTTDTTIASGATVSSHAPGDFWFNTEKQQLFINTGTDYTLIGPEAVPGFGKTKLSSEVLLDNGLRPHPVIKIVLDGEVIGVLSNDTFMGGVEASSLGFGYVYRGLTLKNYSPGTRYSTTSTDVVFHGLHEQLDESYPRRDQDEHLTGNWFVDNNYMLQFGSAGNSKISFQESGGNFPNKLVIEHGSGLITLSSNGSTLTFNGDSFAPNANETQSLGQPGQRFNNVYTKTINAGSALASGSIIGSWQVEASSLIAPASDNGNDLGASALRWKNVYAFGLNSGADQGTIKGNWQLASGIEFIPQSDGSNDLGSSGRKFSTVYTNGLSSADPFTPLNVTGELTVDGSIIPTQDQVYNIGSPQATYNTIYSSSVVSDTANIGSLSATINQLLDSFSNSISRFDRDAQLTANSDSRLPTQRAVKAYVDATKNVLIGLIEAVQGSLQNSINGLEFVPAGTVFYHAASTAPSGFLVCDGSAKSTASYPALFAAIGYTYGGAGGTFNLPDLRGEFIRGADQGRGVDSGRTVGTAQGDAFRSHKHGVTLSQEQGGSHDQYGFPQVDWSGPNIYHSPDEPDGSTCYRDGRGNFMHSTGGSETRPRNVALLPIIKY